MGTFQYMSPEQVDGKEVDTRSDIFSLGAVLYEMLTGRCAFEGKSQWSVASAILEKQPEPVSAVRPMAPQALDHAIRTCLAKDPEKRWQTARDVAHTLRWIAESGPRAGTADSQVRHGRTRERWLIGLLAATAAAALALGLTVARRTPAEGGVIRSSIKPMPGSSLLVSDASGFALSRDGRKLAYVASTSDAKSLLWIRPDRFVARGAPGRHERRQVPLLVPYEAGEPSTAITLVANWPRELRP